MTPDPSRRQFLQIGGGAAGASWLATQWPLALQAAERATVQRDQGAPLRHLQADEAADLEAIAARIVPATDTPGAREVGVIHFIDSSIGGWMAGVEQLLRPGLAALNATSSERFGAQRFHQLDGDGQDALLKDIDDGPFFQTMRMMTVAGMFALPSYGGNRGQLGWALIGFNPRHVWAPPFGHYDAPHHRGAAPDAQSASHEDAPHGH